MIVIGANTVSGLLFGGAQVSAIYAGTQKVYPDVRIDSGFDYTEWVYELSVRTRTATPWTQVVYEDGTRGPKEYGEPFTQTQSATETLVGEWTYQWTVSGESTRRRTVYYRWPDGAVNYDEDQVQTGGQRTLAFVRYAGNIPAAGGSTTCHSVSMDCWDDQKIADNPIGELSLSIDNGFSVSAQDDVVTITRGPNPSASVSATLTGTKEGFASGQLVVSQDSDLQSGTGITYDDTSITYNDNVLVWL